MKILIWGAMIVVAGVIGADVGAKEYSIVSERYQNMQQYVREVSARCDLSFEQREALDVSVHDAGAKVQGNIRNILNNAMKAAHDDPTQENCRKVIAASIAISTTYNMQKQ